MSKIDTVCPICGGKNLYYERDKGHRTENIICSDCDAYFMSREDYDVQLGMYSEIIDDFINILKEVNK